MTLAGFALATNRLSVGTGVVTLDARSAGTLRWRPPASRTSPAAGRSWGSVRARAVRSARSGVTWATSGPRSASWSSRTRRGRYPDLARRARDRMVALAGEVADGVLLNWCTPERVARAATLVREAAERAGRDPVGGDHRRLRARLPRHRRGRRHGSARRDGGTVRGDPALSPAVRGHGPGRGRAARRAPPDAVVRALTVAGGRTRALARFDAFREAGADLVLCYPVAALDPLSSVMGTVLAAAPDPAVER